MKKITQNNVIVSKTFSLKIFLYLTNNDFQENEKLISFLQEHNLNFKRLKGKEYKLFSGDFPFFYKNANFVVWSTQSVSKEVFFLLMQFLISQITVLVCFYKGQLWTFSRLKQIPKMFFKSGAPSKIDNSVINTLWRCFQNQNF